MPDVGPSRKVPLSKFISVCVFTFCGLGSAWVADSRKLKWKLIHVNARNGLKGGALIEQNKVRVVEVTFGKAQRRCGMCQYIKS